MVFWRLNEAMPSVYDAGCDACALQVDAALARRRVCYSRQKTGKRRQAAVLATLEMFTPSSSQGFVQ